MCGLLRVLTRSASLSQAPLSQHQDATLKLLRNSSHVPLQEAGTRHPRPWATGPLFSLRSSRQQGGPCLLPTSILHCSSSLSTTRVSLIVQPLSLALFSSPRFVLSTYLRSRELTSVDTIVMSAPLTRQLCPRRSPAWGKVCAQTERHRIAFAEGLQAHLTLERVKFPMHW